MRLRLLPLALLAAPLAAQQPVADRYRDVANKIIDAALADFLRCVEPLAAFVDYSVRDCRGAPTSSGHRLDAGRDEEGGLVNVRGEPVMVPHWCAAASPSHAAAARGRRCRCSGSGARWDARRWHYREVLVVTSFDDLTARAAEAKGRIVLFDVPFTNTAPRCSTAVVGERRRQGGRRGGTHPRLSARGTAHAAYGAMGYDSTGRSHSSAAIPLEDAAMLHRSGSRPEDRADHPHGGQDAPDAPHATQWASWPAADRPQRSSRCGHIDSWDCRLGAMDDAGGIVVAWDGGELLKRLGSHRAAPSASSAG